MSEELKKSIENADSKEELMEKLAAISDEALNAVSGGENEKKVSRRPCGEITPGAWT